ncbi:MAG: lysozyme [Flavobacterium sp.]|nr:MAG: lysozyme [Flavobacterium sp.]
MNWKAFLNLLVTYEGLKTSAYKDSVGIYTIGIGTIKYPNGTPVKKGDKCTEAQAYEYAEHEAKIKLEAIKKMLKVEQTDNQLMALLSLAYNIGEGGLRTSTLLKSINEGKDIATIEENWLRWNKGTVNGKKVELKGLTVRRKSELKLYKTA